MHQPLPQDLLAILSATQINLNARIAGYLSELTREAYQVGYENGWDAAGPAGADLGQTPGNTPVEIGRSDGLATGSDQRERAQNGRSEH